MKIFRFSLTVVTLVIGIVLLSESGSAEGFIEEAAVRYGSRRPFSFYYPYNYQYYTPHRNYYSNSSYGSSACYWRYENGSYVYFCQ